MGKMTNKSARFLVAAVLLSLPAQSFGLTVDSTALAPADGTTGQTTSSGNGVKTGHIQNGAVSSPKIAVADGTTGQDVTQGSGVKTNHIQNAAITSPKLADGAVTSTKIGPGAVGINAIATGAVTSIAIAPYAVITGSILDGAVTDAKISGQISGSKINGVGLNADTVDGKHAADFAGPVHYHVQSDVVGLSSALAGKADTNHNHDAQYRKKHSTVIVVAKDGSGDFDNPVNALNSITDASASKPYLIKIMPGVYDLGTSGLSSQRYVSIHGSGTQNTRLISNLSGDNAVVNGCISDIRDLTVVNTGTGHCISTSNYIPISSLNISNVDMVSNGIGIRAYFSGYNVKFYNVNITSQSTAIITRYNAGQFTNVHTNSLISIQSDGDNTYFDNVNVNLTNPTLTAGLFIQGAAKIVNTSTNGAMTLAAMVSGMASSISNSEMDTISSNMYRVVISNSKINSGIAQNEAGNIPIICSNVYDKNYNPAICR